MRTIEATASHIGAEEARLTASRRNAGLIDRIIQLFGSSRRPPAEIESVEFFYHPLWFIGAKMSFERPGLDPRIIFNFFVVDGFFGSIDRVVGLPNAVQCDAGGTRVTECALSADQAREILVRQLTAKLSLKYKNVPSAQIMESRLIYKPYYDVAFSRGSLKFHRVVDAESGARNYFLDVKVEELRYES